MGIVRRFTIFGFAIVLAACGGTAGPSSAPAPPASAPASLSASGAQPSAPGASAPAKPAASASAGPKRGGTVKIGIWQEPETLNPLAGSQTAIQLAGSTILEGLVSPQPDGTYAARLATQVPTKENGGVSADGLTVTYKLKPGITWSDGQPFTSKDVVFNFKRASYLTSVTAPDDGTAVMKYKSLYAAYLTDVRLIVPEHAIKGDSRAGDQAFNKAPIGTGPFVLKEWKPGDSITLVRNDKYREQGKPYLDSIVFKILPSREAEIQAYKAGEVDVIWDIPESALPDLEKIADSVANSTPNGDTERLILNASCPSGPQQGDPKCPHPVLGDVKVRQAIELAIDKKAIVDKALFGKTTVATSVIPLGWYAPQLAPSEFSPDKAKQLLDQAGWKPGADAIRQKGSVRAHLSYGTTAGDALREQTQQLIQGMLKNVGIEVEIKNVPSGQLLSGWDQNSARSKGNFDMLMWTTSAGLDPQGSLLDWFSEDSVPTAQRKFGQNYARVIDPDLDKALAAAEGTLDQNARKDAYKTAAERINADHGVIALYNRLRIEPSKSYVQGIQLNGWNSLTWDAQNWWVNK